MDPMQIVIIAVAALVAGGVLVWGIRSLRSEEAAVEERLQNLGMELEPVVQEVQEEEKRPTKKASALQDNLDKLIEERSFGKKWRIQLMRANLKITVAEFAALHIIAMIGLFIVGYFVLFGQQLVMGIISAFVGFFVPRIYLSFTVGKRLKQFESQLPDTISLWVNALRSGYSVPQAMEAIGRDAPEPTATEFKRVVQEMQIGIPMYQALDHMLERVESDDLDLIVTAVNIQREVGGNLAEILDVIGHTVRERIKLKGEIGVLTAQGRITGYLISFLPIVLALFLYSINPDYMGNLFENQTCGWPLLGVGLTLIGIGAAVINKIVDIDI
ncbi:MAG: type II secretion system F family protein [Chloroflexota bacterium]|nr:type II secretion system F family protein [Chloroflexota bacterium]